MLYQTSPKFRDEKRIKTGVLRSKEFLMTDLYSSSSNVSIATPSMSPWTMRTPPSRR